MSEVKGPSESAGPAQACRPLVLVWSRDLFFSSQLPSLAGPRFDVRTVPQIPRDLIVPPALVLVDLDSLGVEVTATADDSRPILVTWRDHYPGTVWIGFGSHVHAERLAAARSLGCDDVVTRGRLHQGAPSLIQQWCAAGVTKRDV